MMRDFVSDDDFDIERVIAVLGAPPEAPLVIVRQQLEREKATAQHGAAQHGVLLRLLGAFAPKAGQ